MHQILSFIVEHMRFLWEGAKYQIAESKVATSFGGDAFLIIESEALRLRFVSDRSQLFLDVRPNGFKTSSTYDWYSIDLVRGAVSGSHEVSSILDESYATFFRVNQAEIERRFSSENWSTTRRELKKLKARRTKERER